MPPELKSICLIAAGMEQANRRLQPWRYLYEVAQGLSKQGHVVTLLSNGASSATEPEFSSAVSLQRLASVNSPRWSRNRDLQRAIESVQPQVALWHLGLTSLLHQRLDLIIDCPLIGIFTSPLYRPGELARLGPSRLAHGYKLSALHLLDSLLPDALFRRRDLESRLRALVVQSQTTRRQLQERRLWGSAIAVIPPGVDDVWFSENDSADGAIRRALGFSEDNIVVVYFGPPAPLRGLPTLMRAFALALRQQPALRLLVLSRQPQAAPSKEMLEMQRLVQRLGIDRATHWVRGLLDPLELVRYVASSDIVALPFELVPSDAPLSLLETRALGKPLVTTRVACLPELAAGGDHYLAEPADPISLSGAILQAAARLQNRNSPIAGRTLLDAKPHTWWEVGTAWTSLINGL